MSFTDCFYHILAITATTQCSVPHARVQCATPNVDEEKANGRLAMMAVIGMFFHSTESWSKSVERIAWY